MANDAQFEYVQGQIRPEFPELLADFQRLSDAVAPSGLCDLPYGPHPRQRFDHFAPTVAAQGVLLYFHAGYWQSRDKSLFRFMVPAFQRLGFHAVWINYPLCPEVTLAELVDAALQSVPAVRRHLRSQGVEGLPWVVAGHSAGGHLAAECALAHRQDAPPGSVGGIHGVLGISGVYELAPLLGTTLNEKLRLTAESAAQASVVRRLTPGLPPALWVVGGTETQAFLEQNAAMHAAWSNAGNWSAGCPVPGADHFTVLKDCPQWSGEAGAAFGAWWRAVRQCFSDHR